MTSTTVSFISAAAYSATLDLSSDESSTMAPLPMLTWSLPCSLADLPVCFRPCFTAPTFQTFTALVGGFLAQPGLRTVTGMLSGARLAGRWPGSRGRYRRMKCETRF